MNEIIIALLGIVSVIIGLPVLYNMPKDFIKEFEKSCHGSIKKRDKEFEEKEKLTKEFRKWIFK